MTVAVLSSQNPFRLTLGSAAEVVEGEVVLTADNLLPTGFAADVAAISATADAGLPFALTTTFPVVSAGSPTSVFVPSPVAGTISRAALTFNNTVATGSLTATLRIGGVAVTGGACTLALAAAAGTVGSATPSAANAVSTTVAVEVLVGGTNSAAGFATVTIWVTPTVA